MRNLVPVPQDGYGLIVGGQMLESECPDSLYPAVSSVSAFELGLTVHLTVTRIPFPANDVSQYRLATRL
jgi:hypothetical protein